METIKDIVKAFRDGSIYDENGCFDSRELADRIEAAYEREKAPRIIDSFDTMRDALRAYDDEMPDDCSASHWIIRYDDWGLNSFLNWLKSTDEGGAK